MLINNTTAIETTGSSGTYKYYTSPLFQVKKGDVVEVTQATYSKKNEVKFFPVE